MLNITKNKQIKAIAACDITANETLILLICETSRTVGIIKPKNPTMTATCIRCFLRFSFDLAMTPKINSNKPNAAGINAVRLVLPSMMLKT